MADIKIDLLLEANEALKSIKGFSAQANKELSTIKFASIINSIDSIGRIASSAFRVVSNAISEPIKAAEEQEDAINRLNAALKINGNLTPEVSKSLQDFASELQNVSRFADDVILNGVALLQTLAPLSEVGLKEATQAALDLASGLRIDVNTAFNLVGRAATGNVELFSRYGLQIKKAATDSETFANTLKGIQNQFGGRALADTETFAGGIQRVRNSIGDTLEEFGNFIIKNNEVNKSLNEVNKAILEFTQFLIESAPTIRGFISNSINSLTFLFNTIRKGIEFFSIGFVQLEKVTFSSISFVTEQIANLLDSLSKIPRIGDFFKDSINSLRKFSLITEESAKASDEAVNDLVNSTSGLKKEVRTVASTVNSTKNTGSLFLAGAKSNIADVTQELEKLKSTLKNAGLNKIEIAVIERQDRLKIIDEALKQEKINIKEASDLRKKIELDFQKNKLDFEKTLLEEQKKAAQSQIDDATSFLNSIRGQVPGAGQKGDAGNVSGTNQLIIASAEAGNQLLKGAEGALNVIKAGIGTAATAILGPIGQVVGPVIGEVISTLAKGPEAVRQLITEFAQAIPTIITNILTAIPEALITQFELLGPLIEKLFEVIPAAIESFIQRLPDVIQALVQGAVRAGATLTARMPFVATELATSLIAEAPNIAAKTIDAFVSEAPRFITELIKQIPQAAGGVVGGIGGAAGGIFGGIGDAIGGIGDIFGFAGGGGVEIPRGDTLIAGFNAKETVINEEQTQRFNRLLDYIESSNRSNAPTTIQLIIGENELASVMLDLNRRGFRIS